MKLTDEQVRKLRILLSYSNRYQISIQFWPGLTAVYISKDSVDLKDWGGEFDHAVGSAIRYLRRINKEDK